MNAWPRHLWYGLLFCGVSLCLLTPATAGTIYGLEWSGTGPFRRMLYWSNPFPIYPATYIFRVYPREKFGPADTYYTTFFWGNNGTFCWQGGTTGCLGPDSGLPNTYYGAHPYPIPCCTGPGQWEISVHGHDTITGTEVTWDRWHVQAFRAWRENASTTHHEFYYDLPDTAKLLTDTLNDSAWATTNPPSPAIVMGQAPDYQGKSWGGSTGWEEFNGRIRGIQIYSGLLSLAEIQAEIASPLSTAAGQTHIWYLNLNPRPTDVTDQKGTGTSHHPAWAGVPALEWSETTGDSLAPGAPTNFRVVRP